MAELSYKDKIKAIETDRKISDKNKAILALIKKEVEGLKEEDAKIKFLRDEISDPHRTMFIGEPLKSFKLVDEKYNRQVEPVYFWLLGFLRDQLGAKKVIKLVDTYSASEASAFHRNVGQGLAATQDRVVASLRNIAALLQHLFRIVRELSMLTERLYLYYDGERIGPEKEGGKQNFAEMTLKDMYISFVEGGTKNPGSVLGLASQVGFNTLPHLFYHTHFFKTQDVEEGVNKIKGINRVLIEVLGRKLRAYVGWRQTSLQQLETRRKFMLSFLKQHYSSIKLNIEWVKPYLKQAKRMQMNEDFKDSPDLLAAIEQAMMEIELMAVMKEDPEYNQVINAQLRFRTHPESEFSPRFQQTMTRFTGRIELELQARVLSDAQIVAYKAKIMKEDFSLLGFDDAIKEALDTLGKDLVIYLEQAEKDVPQKDAVLEAMQKKGKDKKKKEEKEEEEKKPWYYGADPFIQIFKGFAEIGGAFVPSSPFKKSAEKKKPKHKVEQDENDAKEGAVKSADKLYNTFKKSHGMLAW